MGWETKCDCDVVIEAWRWRRKRVVDTKGRYAKKQNKMREMRDFAGKEKARSCQL